MLLDLETLRAETPGCAHRTHLNNAGAALMTSRTIATMHEHLALEAEIGGYEAEEAVASRLDAVRDSTARLVGGRSEEIAFFDNSTHAWNAAFYSLPLGPGDRILTGRDEYGSAVLAYLQVAERTGAELVVVPNDDTGAIDVGRLRDLIDDRVKLIGLTWVPTSGGLVNPAEEVGRIAREADLLYLLDATQAVGQLPIDVETLGCDLLTGTGRKFLRGPRGTGFLWADRRALDRLDPFVAEIASATWDGGRSFTWEAGAQRFETWENSYMLRLGFGAAVDQALELGLPAIAERTVGLGERLRQGLAELAGVTVHDLGTERCGIVTARVDRVESADVKRSLAALGINVSTTVPEHNALDTEVRPVHPLVRFSPHYFNTEEEIDHALTAVQDLTRSH